VSRALMQHAAAASSVAPQQASALSHSGGYAIYIAGCNIEAVGVDLEPMALRDVMSLARLCCTDEERLMLETVPEDRRCKLFYTLWTLKEAFIKAANLNFPADMRKNGLTKPRGLRGSAGEGLPGYQLFTSLPGNWHAATYCLDEKWIASAVWRRKPGLSDEEITWHAGPHTHLPSIDCCGIW
jgi:4'-phosphopantetheinyl transferase